MHRDEATTELGHLRTTDCGLEPLSMMERRVPVVDGRVIATERDFKIVALRKPYRGSLHFSIEPGCGRRARPGVRPGREAEFAKEAHPRGECGTEVECELALLEAGVRIELTSGSETAGGAMQIG